MVLSIMSALRSRSAICASVSSIASNTPVSTHRRYWRKTLCAKSEHSSVADRRARSQPFFATVDHLTRQERAMLLMTWLYERGYNQLTQRFPGMRRHRDIKPKTIEHLDGVRKLLRELVAWHRRAHADDIDLIDRYFNVDAFERELAGLPGEYQLAVSDCRDGPHQRSAFSPRAARSLVSRTSFLASD